MTKIKARTRHAIPRRLRGGERFGPQWAEYEVSDKALKAIQEDGYLEVEVVDGDKSKTTKKKASKKAASKG